MNIEKKCHNFELCNATLKTITKILACLDTSKHPDLDRIFLTFLKDGAGVLTLPLSNLINLSIKQSLFPDQYKIAKLKPLFKKGSNSDLRNYSSISLLPVVSKIKEKTIHNQMQEYWIKMAYFVSISQVFTQIFQQSLAFYNLRIFYSEKWKKYFTLR